MTEHTSTSAGNSDAGSTSNGRTSSDEAWSSLEASHRDLQRVEDTLDVAHACMDAVVVGFFTGTYTAQETVALGRALVEWADQLHHELAQLRQTHQAHVDAWLAGSPNIA